MTLSPLTLGCKLPAFIIYNYLLLYYYYKTSVSILACSKDFERVSGHCRDAASFLF